MKKPELKTLYYGFSQNQERTIDHYSFWEWFWGQRIWKGGAGDKDDTFLRETRHSKKKKKKKKVEDKQELWFISFIFTFIFIFNLRFYIKTSVPTEHKNGITVVSIWDLFRGPQKNLIYWPRIVLESIKPLNSGIRFREIT